MSSTPSVVDSSSIDSYRQKALIAAWETITAEMDPSGVQQLKEELDGDPIRWSTTAAHLRAEQSKLALRALLGTRDAAGQAILKELWFVALNGLYLFDGARGAEYNSIEEWAEAELSSTDDEIEAVPDGDAIETETEEVTEDYILRLARIVDRIFMDVNQKRPYDANGELITPDRLIDTPKLLKKMLRASYAYSKLVESEQKGAPQQAIQDQKREILESILTSQNAITVGKVCDRVLGKQPGSIRYKYSEIPKGGDCFDLMVEGLTQTDLRIAKKLLRGLLASA